MPIQIRPELHITRDELWAGLRESHIFPRKYFYPIATQYDCYKNGGLDYSVPTAEKVGNTILTLPLYYNMGIDTVEFVCEKIKELVIKYR